MHKLELMKRARSIVVPTNDEFVKLKLREIGQPIILFGEKVRSLLLLPSLRANLLLFISLSCHIILASDILLCHILVPFFLCPCSPSTIFPRLIPSPLLCTRTIFSYPRIMLFVTCSRPTPTHSQRIEENVCETTSLGSAYQMGFRLVRRKQEPSKSERIRTKINKTKTKVI